MFGIPCHDSVGQQGSREKLLFFCHFHFRKWVQQRSLGFESGSALLFPSPLLVCFTQHQATGSVIIRRFFPQLFFGPGGPEGLVEKGLPQAVPVVLKLEKPRHLQGLNPIIFSPPKVYTTLIARY